MYCVSGEYNCSATHILISMVFHDEQSPTNSLLPTFLCHKVKGNLLPPVFFKARFYKLPSYCKQLCVMNSNTEDNGQEKVELRSWYDKGQ